MERDSALDASHATVLDVCRRVMLMQPVAVRFDELPMLSPVERVKLAATVVIQAAQEHQYIKDIVTRSGALAAFQAIARARTGGHIDLPQLKPAVYEDEDKPREST